MGPTIIGILEKLGPLGLVCLVVALYLMFCFRRGIMKILYDLKTVLEALGGPRNEMRAQKIRREEFWRRFWNRLRG